MHAQAIARCLVQEQGEVIEAHHLIKPPASSQNSADKSRCETVASQTASKAWYLLSVDGASGVNGALAMTNTVPTLQR
jgi:hypothetical protein